LHLELGEAYVDPVQIGKHIAKQQERQKPPIKLVIEGRDAVWSLKGLNS
jgi:hypothetical protein